MKPKIDKKKFYQAVGNLNQIKILVIGDIILDEYLLGEVERISPEAPVPIVQLVNEKITLGGCGNVVKNLSEIGVKTFLISRCGLDEKQKYLEKLLAHQKIEESFLIKSREIPTILKTRIIAKNQQLCRIDRENNLMINEKEEKVLFQKTKNLLKIVDGVILSDYAKGLLTKTFIRNTIQESKKHKIPIFVDPQVKNFFDYLSVTTLTPNHLEIGAALGKKLNVSAKIEQALKEVTEKLKLNFLVVTRGKEGMSLYLPQTEKFFHIPTVSKEVFDVTGAGDTVISILSAFFIAGLNEIEATLISNVAAGVVVNKFGSAVVSCEEIEKSLLGQNLFE